jgi:putative exosortase-associated protein (TIGR04073 family)
MRINGGSYKRRGIAWVLGTCAILLLGSDQPAAAESTALGKAGRGLAAIVCGFLEVPGNMALETRRHGSAYGFTLGFAKGLGGVVVRELVGTYELVTAPIEVPSHYQPLLSPEYPWDYFDDSAVVANDRYPIVSPTLGSRPDELREASARGRVGCAEDQANARKEGDGSRG